MRSGSFLPREGGVYVLRLELDEPAEATAGALGSRRLPRGSYAYVGSAHGPGGLAARLGRHLSGTGRRRWHVDHLRAVARPVSAWFAAVPGDREHGWAGLLATALGGRYPWPGFGASDCRCEAHLLHFSQAPALDDFRRAAAGAWPGDPPTLEVSATESRPAPLAGLRNLGPASAAWLAEAGIRDADSLARHGAVGAWLAVARTGRRPGVDLLYAVAGALSDTHWARLPDEERRRLVIELDMQREPEGV